MSAVVSGCDAVRPLSGEGIPTRVEVLDRGFVRCDGRRMPTDAFLVEIRQRIRDAVGDTSRYPNIRILSDQSLPPGTLDGLLRELQSAGVRHITLG